MSAGDRLRPKRRAFAEHYVGGAHFNGAEAYRRAGYSAPTVTTATTEAHRLLTNPDVQEYIDELIADSGVADKLSPKAIITGIYKLLQRAIKAEDRNAEARALEMMGRAHAMFKDVQRTEDTRTEDLLASVADLLSDDQKLALAESAGLDPKELGISEH